jgi:hypothetical protein
VHQIRGLTDDQLKVLEDQAETAMRTALQQVVDRIADRIAKIQVASAAPVDSRALWVGCRHCLHPRHDGPCW